MKLSQVNTKNKTKGKNEKFQNKNYLFFRVTTFGNLCRFIHGRFGNHIENNWFLLFIFGSKSRGAKKSSRRNRLSDGTQTITNIKR